MPLPVWAIKTFSPETGCAPQAPQTQISTMDHEAFGSDLESYGIVELKQLAVAQGAMIDSVDEDAERLNKGSVYAHK